MPTPPRPNFTLEMIPLSLSDVQLAFATHQNVIYGSLGILLLSVGFHYASKVNSVEEGEPPLFPGALPLVGHAFTFLKDNYKIYEAIRDWSPNSHPVSLSMFGKRIYVVLNGKDTAASWRSKGLAFEPVLKWAIHQMFNVSPEGCERMQTDPDGRGDIFVYQHSYFRDSLAPGEALNRMTKKFLYFFEIECGKLEQELRSTPNQEITVPLQLWCRDRLGTPSAHSLFGPQLLENEPRLLEYLCTWEDDYFKFALGLPKFLRKKGADALEKATVAFMKHGNAAQQNDTIVLMPELMDARGVSDRDMAASNFGLYHGTQTNAIPTLFWVIYQLLRHPKERAAVEQEIAPAFSPSPSDPQSDTLTNLEEIIEKAPVLHAVYWEVLRYTSGGGSNREVMEDTYINGWKFKKGSMVMMPLRPNHFDPKVYGPNPDEFIPDRFIADFVKTNDPTTTTTGSKGPTIKTMKPFGGGITLCPGRHFAANEIFAFVATLFRRFDIELVDGQPEAKPRMGQPAIGVYPPDHDVMVKIKLRK